MLVSFIFPFSFFALGFLFLTTQQNHFSKALKIANPEEVATVISVRSTVSLVKSFNVVGVRLRLRFFFLCGIFCFLHFFDWLLKNCTHTRKYHFKLLYHCESPIPDRWLAFLCLPSFLCLSLAYGYGCAINSNCSCFRFPSFLRFSSGLRRRSHI